MRDSIQQALDLLFTKYPETLPGPVSDKEIHIAEGQLGIVLPADYREFVQKYGGAVVGGLSIVGLKDAEWLDQSPPSFVELTLKMREWTTSHTTSMVIFAVDSSGNPVGFLPPDQRIFVLDHDFGGKIELARDFEHFIELLLSQEIDL